MEKERYKYRICYSKDGAMRFIGHLDLLRLFQRAIKRSGLPVAYSAGFNPHQLISFAMPLPIGHSGAAEYADIEFEYPPEDIISPLAAQLPGGLEVIGARPLCPGERAAAALTAAAVYEIEFPAPIGFDINEIMSAGSIIIEKKTKSGTAMTDIRPDILSLSADGRRLLTMLSAGSARNLKPELLVKYIGGTEPFTVKYKRIEIFKETSGGGHEPLMNI
ncbi:MAG: TIGR03936 family radical SAM-associated protein [Defluviitaleaceae bacterium]|nr:TIGR03936 family radical SAM-associated protein [Defluviitaleaceae bacterium]